MENKENIKRTVKKDSEKLSIAEKSNKWIKPWTN